MVFPAQSRTKAQHRQITPDTARVLIASVMGLDKFHEFGQSTEEKLDLVNVFQQQDTFASRRSAPVELILTYGEEALGMATQIDMEAEPDNLSSTHRLSINCFDAAIRHFTHPRNERDGAAFQRPCSSRQVDGGALQ